MSEQPFTSQREAALALLNSGCRLSRKAGQFLGQLVADATPMSELQLSWISKLLNRAGLPPFVGEGV
jgi:hypothetical protein